MANLDGKQTQTILDYVKGAAIGIVAAVIIGQFWPGYMLDSNVRAEVEQRARTANIQSASLLCEALYKAVPENAVKLAALRDMQSYAASNDSAVVAAAKQALKLYAVAGIEPAPYEYSLQSECVSRLQKPAAKAAELKR